MNARVLRTGTPRCFWAAGNLLWLCSLHTCPVAAAEPRAATTAIRGPGHAQTAHPPARDFRFAHLTTKDGLSQGYVTAIVQDRRGFMWFATRDGLNRYDGYTFVVYKHVPNDPGSLNSNFIQDLLEDDRGYLWIATNTGLNRFDPTTERATRFLHDPNNPNTIGGVSVNSIAKDSGGYLWLATGDGGVDKLDPTTGTFTHYRNDSDGRFVGRITQVIQDRQRNVWFVGERGLFHLNQQGQITGHPASTSFSASSVYADDAGSLWLLVDSPGSALVKYDRQAKRFTRYPVGAGGVGSFASTTVGGSANAFLAADGQNGLWVPSSVGLYYFDLRTERFTYRFQHDESDIESLDSNTVLSIHQDRNGVLWVGTENAGINILNFRQHQFVRYVHRPADPSSVSAGRVKAIYQDREGVLWVGFFPRALDRLDRRTSRITHYLPNAAEKNSLGPGTTVDSIYKDAEDYLWVSGGDSGVVRFNEATGRSKHYRPDPDNPKSLVSSNVYTIFGDRNGQIWVGQEGGIGRYDPASDGFITYRPVPDNPASLANAVWIIYQDRSGMLWAGTWGGTLFRFDDKGQSFASYTPDPLDSHRLNGGGINTIHEDRMGTLWVGTFDGLYRHDRRTGEFTRYTEVEGLPSSSIRCILEDRTGRLWLSTQKGISRFDPQTEAFRNYDVSDGLQSDEFSTGCYQSADGEMFFGGTKGFNAFVPENVRDNPYVPPVAITTFRIFNKPVAIGAESVLKRAVPYIDALTLSYRDNVFSFEFAALSYVNAQRNRYRYMLENFDSGWNDADSKQRVATYTNLNPGRYVFRVQGSNSDGVWNEAGVRLPILITPPWWMTGWFRALCVGAVLAGLWAAYLFRMRQVQQKFQMTLEARVGERTRIARDLHDTLLQSCHGLLLRLQTVSYLLAQRPSEAKHTLDAVIEQAARAITEGRDAVQGLRASTVESNDLAMAIRTLGDELTTGATAHPPPAFRVGVEGHARQLRPIVRDEIYRIAAEAVRNCFGHAQAGQVEVEIRYDRDQFRLRVRDDGRGIDQSVLAAQGIEGHYGLRGMPERAALIGGKLAVWSEVGAGTEVELRIPASAVYTPARKRSRWSRLSSSSMPAEERGEAS